MVIAVWDLNCLNPEKELQTQRRNYNGDYRQLFGDMGLWGLLGFRVRPHKLRRYSMGSSGRDEV